MCPRHEIEVADRCLGHRARVPQPVHRSAEPQIFEDRELRIERQPLRHVTDTLADVCGLALKNEPRVHARPRRSGFRIPASMRSAVVLPAPLAPTKPQISPAHSVSVTSATAIVRP